MQNVKRYYICAAKYSCLSSQTFLPAALDILFAKNTRPVVKALPIIYKGAEYMLYNSQVTGQIIGKLRTERGMSQEVLSGLAGIARTHLTMIENGSKSANVETLWKISAALDMPLSKLIIMVEQQLKENNISDSS